MMRHDHSHGFQTKILVCDRLKGPSSNLLFRHEGQRNPVPMQPETKIEPGQRVDDCKKEANEKKERREAGVRR